MEQDDGRFDIGRVDDEANQGNEWAEFVRSHFDPAKAAPAAVRDRGRQFLRGAGGAMIPVQRIVSAKQVRAHRLTRQKP